MIKEILFFALMLIVGACIVIFLFNRPIVYWSVSQDKCVRITDSNYDCNNLPDTYEIVYIK